MSLQLKVTAAASAVSLAAGLLTGYFIFSQREVPETVKTANEVVRKNNTSDSEFVFAEKSKSDGHMIENIELVKQMPELPTGCEVTSLTMVLNYLGYGADKLDIARDYLEKQDIETDDSGELLGPDYRYVFAGNPEDDKSFGCFAPCLVSAADKYLEDNESSLIPVDLTGTEFDELLGFVDHDIPVIMWSTLGLAAPEYNLRWTTPDGEEVTWPTNEHCTVLTGYIREENSVQIHDPINGVIRLNLEAVKERYDQLGKNAAVIIKNKE